MERGDEQPYNASNSHLRNRINITVIFALAVLLAVSIIINIKLILSSLSFDHRKTDELIIITKHSHLTDLLTLQLWESSMGAISYPSRTVSESFPSMILSPASPGDTKLIIVVVTLLVSYYIDHILCYLSVKDDKSKALQSTNNDLLSIIRNLQQGITERDKQIEQCENELKKAHRSHQSALNNLSAKNIALLAEIELRYHSCLREANVERHGYKTKIKALQQRIASLSAERVTEAERLCAKDAQIAESEHRYRSCLHKANVKFDTYKIRIAALQQKICSLSAEKANEVERICAKNKDVIEKLQINYQFNVAELEKNLEQKYQKKLKQMHSNHEQLNQYPKRQFETQTNLDDGNSDQNIQKSSASNGLRTHKPTKDYSNSESPVNINTLEQDQLFEVPTSGDTLTENNRSSIQIEEEIGITTVTPHHIETEVGFKTFFIFYK